MGGCDNCTRVQLTGLQTTLPMKQPPRIQSRHSLNEVEARLYHHLAERMAQMSVTTSRPSPKARPVFPDSLRAIVETAWIACTQDNSGDLVVPEPTMSPLHKHPMGHTYDATMRASVTPVSTTAANATTRSLIDIPRIHSYDQTLAKLEAYTRSSIPSRQLSPVQLSLSSKSDMSDLLLCDPTLTFHTKPSPRGPDVGHQPRMRPLLRQRESYITPISSDATVRAEESSANRLASQALINAAKPMQVHRRQVIPRKQDAIYNARYKTQPCLHYQKSKRCPLGDNCHFAHGPDELLHPQMHPKYRTRICLNYAQTGTCPFGAQCYFLHATPSTTNIASTNVTKSSCPEATRPFIGLWVDRRHTVCGT